MSLARPKTPRLAGLSISSITDENLSTACGGHRPLGLSSPSMTNPVSSSPAENHPARPPVASPSVIDLSSLPGVDCPCGVARRAFGDHDAFVGTVHLTQISRQAREHFHKEHTEIYVVLECADDAAIELDGHRYPVGRHHAILIPPGVRHRACGEMTVLIICTPEFDPDDEHF